MDDARIGRSVLVLRQRRGWRQVDLAARANISASAVSDIERGHLDRYTLASVRAVLRALDASASLDVRWHGLGDLDRLLDGDHARLQTEWATRHRDAGWDVWNKASFSFYGERGRIDQLAFHRASRILEVAERKTGLWDTQATLGLLDMKIRLAPRIAADRRWRAVAVAGALVFLDGRTVRRRIDEHEALFARYSVRGRAADAWIQRPHPVDGLLSFVSLPNSNHTGLRRAGQQRVRVRRPSRA